MTYESKISAELAPFFQYANASNRSAVVRTWQDENQRTRAHLIYHNCVACNVPRFSVRDLDNQRSGTNTYFCDPCHKKVAVIVSKYEKEDSYDVLNRLWNDHLYSRL